MKNDWRKPGMLTVILAMAAVWCVLLLQFGQGKIAGTFFILYVALGIGSWLPMLAFWVMDFFKGGRVAKTPAGLAFFVAEESPIRPLSFGYLPIVTVGLVTVLVAVLVGGLGQQLFNPLDPYTASFGLSQESLSQHGALQNFFLGAVIPGFFEEAVVFAGNLATIFALLLIIGRGNPRISANPLVYWMVAVASTALWAFLFAIAHGRYVGQDQALIYAFSFSFIVQMMNLLTGSFVSWLPHIVHNGLVVAAVTQSFVLFATAFPFWRVRHNG